MLLQIENVSKLYINGNEASNFVIRTPHLSIPEGECFALLGPSGCGKTTLLKLVAGLLEPDDGKIILGDQDLTDVPAEKRQFGMVFQQPLLFPNMSVIENVAFGLKMQGINKQERLLRARDMLKAVGLAGMETRNPSELSGGQQQRVSLARAIVIRPRLLLMDEPFSALDSEIRGEMRQLVRKMHHSYQITMLFVTHDRDEAFELADQIGIMSEGTIRQVGKPHDVYRHPDCPDVAKLMGINNLVEGELNNSLFHNDFLQLKILKLNHIKGSGWLVIRPECIRIAKEKEQAHLNGWVTEALMRQGHVRVFVKIGDNILEMTVPLDGRSIPQKGDHIKMIIDSNQVHFIPMK